MGIDFVFTFVLQQFRYYKFLLASFLLQQKYLFELFWSFIFIMPYLIKNARMFDVNNSLEMCWKWKKKKKKKHGIILTKIITPVMFYSPNETFQEVIDFYIYFYESNTFLFFICTAYKCALNIVLYFYVLSKIWRCTNCFQVFIKSCGVLLFFSWKDLWITEMFK